MIKIKYLKQRIKEIQNEANNTINCIIQEINPDDKNILKHFDNDTFYIYSDNLTVKCNEVRSVWCDNEEKKKYYEEIFRNDINESLSPLKIRLENINKMLNPISMKFDHVQDIVNLSNNRVDSLLKHLAQRYDYMQKDFMSCKVGLLGEERVNDEISLFGNYINLKNIRLEILDNNNITQSIENDNILLTRNGIFVIEVKNLGEIGNYDIIIERDGRWLKKSRHNGEKSLLKNVTSQNNRHIGFLNKFINNHLNRSFDNYIEADGIIVLANEKVTIENYNELQNIFRASDIHAYIKRQPVKFREEELFMIKDVLEKNSLPPKKYPITNYYSEVQSNIHALNIFIQKYETLVNKIIEIDKEYTENISIYVHQLEKNTFYCKACYKEVSTSLDKCVNCGSKETIYEEELIQIKAIEEEKRLEKKKLEEEKKKLEEEKKKKKERIIAIIIIALVSTISYIFYKHQFNVNYIDDVYDGLYMVRLNNGLYGYNNENGERVIKAKYTDATPFKNGLACVQIDYDKYGYINTDGEVVIPIEYEYAAEFKDGLAKVALSGEYSEYLDSYFKYGLINTNGEIVANIEYDQIDGFKYGLARVIKGRKYGFINTEGEIVVPIEYEDASGFNHGLARVKKNGKYGYINTNGEIVANIEFDRAYAFSEGLAPVKKNGKYGYINTNGEIVIQLQFARAYSFENGIAEVDVILEGYGSSMKVQRCKIDITGNILERSYSHKL